MFHKKMSCLSWLYLSVLVVILDFITKTWMSVWLNGWGIVHVFPYLNLILAHNSGSAFSFLAWADGWQRWLFATISLGVSVYLVYLLYRGGINHWSACAIALIIGGALGNLYDRLTLGWVVDFIDFHIAHWHFATFNLADAAISVGAALWIIAGYQWKKNT